MVRRDGLRVCYLSYYGYKIGRETMDGFWAEMARLGKDRNPYRAGFLQFVGVGESRQHAMDLYGDAAEYFYGNCLHIDPRFAAPPGYSTEATQRMGLQSQVAKAASYSDKFNKLAREMDAIVDLGYVIIGSPDEVVEQLREVAVNLNVGNLMLLLQFGNMSKELTSKLASVRRPGDAEIEPAVRGVGASLVAAADGWRAACRGTAYMPRLAAE